MFGLTAEKLIVVVLVVALIIGPHRLPAYAERLASTIRAIRLFVRSAQSAAEREMGATLDVTEWRSLDPRQYDPRRIIRDALAEDGHREDGRREDGGRQDTGRRDEAERRAEPSGDDPAQPRLTSAIEDPVTPPFTDAPSEPRRQRRVMVGTSAHPRWVLVDIDEEDDAESSGEAPSSEDVRVASPAEVGAA